MLGGLGRLGRAVSVALALAACGASEGESGGSTSPQAGGGTSPPTPPPAACGASSPAEGSLEDPAFELRATPSGPYAQGQEGRFEIALNARGNYHVNTDYPLAIRLQGPGEVAFPRAELGKSDAAELGAPRARFQIPFTARSAGRHRVTAEVDFAVCTSESCIPDCRMLAVVLPVEAGALPASATATP